MSTVQRLEIQEIGDVTVIRFRDPRITNPLEIEELGQQLYRTLEVKHCLKLVIDFSPVEFLSSALIGKLISLNRKVKVGKAGLLAPSRDTGKGVRVGVGRLPLQIRQGRRVVDGVFASAGSDFQHDARLRQIEFQHTEDRIAIPSGRGGGSGTRGN